MRISVFGLGYVGAVSAACLARDGHHVIGCDIDPIKLDLIRRGESPIIEPGLAELIRHGVERRSFSVTHDASEAITNSELSLLCVGTPSDRSGAQDLTAVRRLAHQLGDVLARKREFHGFVMRSTVAPGTTESIVIETIAERSQKELGVDFEVGFQPEFLREGSSIADYDQPPYTVVGTSGDRLEDVLRSIYGRLPAPFIVTDIRTAEMLKMVANAFHALKITFANEVGRLGQTLGVDTHRVMELICEDRQLNISPAYLRPGFAFGGSCLPKDVRALEALSRQHALSLPMMQGILPSNRIHIEHAADIVLESGRRRVGFIGLSFKSGTDDLRESPLVTLAERFIGRGLELRVFDPEVNLARLIGANKRYIEENIPHIASLMTSDIVDLIRRSDVLVIGRTTSQIGEALLSSHRADQLVVDLVGLRLDSPLRATVRGVCW